MHAICFELQGEARKGTGRLTEAPVWIWDGRIEEGKEESPCRSGYVKRIFTAHAFYPSTWETELDL